MREDVRVCEIFTEFNDRTGELGELPSCLIPPEFGVTQYLRAALVPR